MRLAFLVGFGLLPLWAALAFIGYAFLTMSSENAAMTFWLVGLAAVPANAVTMLIAGLAIAIHSRTSGDSRRKLRLSGGFVALACAGIVVAGAWLALNRQRLDKLVHHERAMVQTFVQNDATVLEAAGEPIAVDLGSPVGSPGELPIWYEVTVHGARTIYAIVDVDRTDGTAKFRLRCTTSLYLGRRDSSKSPCEQ